MTSHLRTFILFPLVVGGILWLAGGCGTGQAGDAPAGDTLTPAAARATAPVEVTVVAAGRKPFEVRVTANGTVQPAKQAVLAFAESGVLWKVHAATGDLVAAGATLAELDPSALQLALERAENDLLVKQDDYRVLLHEYALLKGDTNTRNEAQIRSMMAKSGLAEAKLNVREARMRLDRSRLVAPFGGKVADWSLAAGAQVAAGSAVCLLYDPASLQAVTDLLEPDLAAVRTGLLAEVVPLGYPDLVIRGRLRTLNPKVEESGMVRAYLDLPADPRLLPGMHVAVTLLVPRERRVVVPKEAVVVRSGRKVVFTLDNGLAKWNYVETGMENGPEVEILDGLPDTCTVIISNNIQLSHDAPVRVVSTE